jgi:hypothetical protein
MDSTKLHDDSQWWLGKGSKLCDLLERTAPELPGNTE